MVYRILEYQYTIDSGLAYFNNAPGIMINNRYLILGVSSSNLSAALEVSIRRDIMSTLENSLFNLGMNNFQNVPVTAWRDGTSYAIPLAYANKYLKSYDPGCKYGVNPLDGTNTYSLNLLIVEYIK